MKVMQVNVVYGEGSTGNIIGDIHNGLKKKGIDSIVCYGRGKQVTEEKVYKTSNELFAKSNAFRTRITGLQYTGSGLATNKLIRIIKTHDPDVVHLHCINGYFVNIYRILNFLKKNNIKTVVTLHAEFMYTGSCGHALSCNKWKNNPGCGSCPQLWKASKSYYFDRTRTAWKLMRDAFEGFNDNLIVTSVSPWLKNRAKESQILGAKHHIVIPNGIDTINTFKATPSKWIKEKYDLNNEKIILHVTSNLDFAEDSFKGGWYILELSKRLINENIKIIIVGARGNYDLPTNIISVGRIEDKEQLAAFYSLADVCVVTSKRETFSMVTAEALSCGTPVTGFKAGAPEQIALKKYSSFVEYGDIDSLELELKKWLNKKKKFSKDIQIEAGQTYSKEKMVQKYLDIYKKMQMSKLG